MLIFSLRTCLVGSVASSTVGSHVGSFSAFFTGNNLLLKLLITFSLALKNNLVLFKKNSFSIDFLSLSKFFNSAAKLLCSSSASVNDKYPSCISLKKTIGKEYSLKL